ncbi:hypothetical protein [Paracoccus aestuariivivens]|uniref:Transferrin-binding protein B C-lobe/N-lobe beta barrel domain-containing protein n=1 Tax=Paracoccus aestuariivivens TaxID=1820333 RepID=A0A6L6JCV2_9RHOB|nr:hypothetical protein [Paracoccus aestuariivivens]MTH79790.1 hypothetical protein [Paracoccus aestuariivivens]
MNNTMTFPRIGALTLLATLAACGGSGGGDNDNPAAEYSSDSARAARLVAQTANMTQTAAASMPMTGRAEYDGVVGMAFGGTPGSLAASQMLGEVDLNADFGRGTISGEMDDFTTSDGRELNGELRVTGGRITGSDFGANINGRLTGPGNVPGNVSGQVDGDFLGAGANAIRGTGTGISDRGTVGLIFRGTRDRD